MLTESRSVYSSFQCAKFRAPPGRRLAADVSADPGAPVLDPSDVDRLRRQLSGLSGNGSQPHTDDREPRTGRLYEVFTAYGAPIGRV